MARNRPIVVAVILWKYKSGSAMLSPTYAVAAKCMTASTAAADPECWPPRSTASKTPSPLPASPCTKRSRLPGCSFCNAVTAPALPRLRSSTMVTACPASSSAMAAWLPMKPAPPVTRICAWPGGASSGGYSLTPAAAAAPGCCCCNTRSAEKLSHQTTAAVTNVQTTKRISTMDVRRARGTASWMLERGWGPSGCCLGERYLQVSCWSLLASCTVPNHRTRLLHLHTRTRSPIT
mmetsp:Transcript_11352/g.33710  ORF Transcript_11352/g.33710 Transcript_11352/m.33710 type:complete len:235 (+) Transcript_11352:2180-2884(+)